MVRDFRVGEYLGPKDTKSLELIAGEAAITFEPVNELEGVACTKVVNVVEDVLEDVLEEVEVENFRFESVGGKTVKRSAGKTKVKQVVGQRKVGERVTGQKTVGRKVAIIRGDDRTATFSQRVKDSQAVGENFYVFAEDLESQLHRDSLKDAVMAVLMSEDVIDALKRRLERGPGRPPKQG